MKKSEKEYEEKIRKWHIFALVAVITLLILLVYKKINSSLFIGIILVGTALQRIIFKESWVRHPPTFFHFMSEVISMTQNSIHFSKKRKIQFYFKE